MLLWFETLLASELHEHCCHCALNHYIYLNCVVLLHEHYMPLCLEILHYLDRVVLLPEVDVIVLWVPDCLPFFHQQKMVTARTTRPMKARHPNTAPATVPTDLDLKQLLRLKTGTLHVLLIRMSKTSHIYRLFCITMNRKIYLIRKKRDVLFTLTYFSMTSLLLTWKV